jgi:DNA-binding MarR family transcriptional regulator
MAKMRPQDEFAAPDSGRRRPRPLDLPGETGDISALLRQAAGAQRLAEERFLADLGITPPQLAAMALIGAGPGLLAADLARKSRLTPQTVSLIVANLRRAGLVGEEEGGFAAASRARPLALTTQGESVLRMGRDRVDAAGARLVGGMRPKRERALRRWLAGVIAGLDAPGDFDLDDL